MLIEDIQTARSRLADGGGKERTVETASPINLAEPLELIVLS